MLDEAETQALADAAGECLAAPASRYDPVLVPATFNRRVSAALLDVLLMLFGGGMLSAVLTLVGWAAVFNNDFDGPPRDESLGDWSFLSTFGGLALAYTM